MISTPYREIRPIPRQSKLHKIQFRYFLPALIYEGLLTKDAHWTAGDEGGSCSKKTSFFIDYSHVRTSH